MIAAGSGETKLPISANVNIRLSDVDKYHVNQENRRKKDQSLAESQSLSPKSCKSDKVRKRVTWNSKCKVVLVPTRIEYIESGIDLWFNEDTIATNRSLIKKQLEEFFIKNPSCSSTRDGLNNIINQHLNEGEEMMES